MAYALTAEQRRLATPGTCLRCGKVVEYERNSAGRCCDCHNLEYYERQAQRKAQIKAMPRCQVKGCSMRGTLKVGSCEQVLMCGKHYKIANARMQQRVGGMFWLAWDMSGADALTLLRGM